MLLIDDVAPAVNIERVAGYGFGRIMRQKRDRKADILNADKLPGWRLPLGFLQQRIELRNAGCCARRQRAGRDGVNPDAEWSRN